MLTNLGFNLALLLLSDIVFVIGAANIGYLIYNFLTLNAGWIHRMDRPRQERPWRAPSWVLAAGSVLSFANLAFMGFGADSYGAGTLLIGLSFAALIIPVFFYRHYVQDKGVFPPEMASDLEMVGGERIGPSCRNLALRGPRRRHRRGRDHAPSRGLLGAADSSGKTNNHWRESHGIHLASLGPGGSAPRPRIEARGLERHGHGVDLCQGRRGGSRRHPHQGGADGRLGSEEAVSGGPPCLRHLELRHHARRVEDPARQVPLRAAC